jgi:hypothetical protein
LLLPAQDPYELMKIGCGMLLEWLHAFHALAPLLGDSLESHGQADSWNADNCDHRDNTFAPLAMA